MPPWASHSSSCTGTGIKRPAMEDKVEGCNAAWHECCVFWLNAHPEFDRFCIFCRGQATKNTPLLLLRGALLPTVCDPASSESTCTLPSPMVEEAQ